MPLLLLSALLLLASCGSARDDTTVGEEAGAAPIEDTVAGDLAGAMDRARSVEDTVLEQKRDLDRAIDEAGGD